MPNRTRSIALVALVVGLAVLFSGPPATAQAVPPGVDCADVPLGALPPARPIWCDAPLATGPATFAQGLNSWVDAWQHGLSTAALGEGYQVYERGSLNATLHWRHLQHWMVDISGVDADGPPPWNLGGAMLRPDRAFHFQDGKLVIEAEVAAGIAEYGGAVWPELVVTTAPAPTGHRRDGIYAYDEFAGHYTLGCRLQSNREPICAFFDNSTRGPGETGGDPLGRTGRVFEISHFQSGASPWGEGAALKWGGHPSIGNLGQAWRVCQGTDPDLNCRDHFKWVIERDHFTMYVNGVKYMEHAGFPAAQQLPDAFLTAPVYVYFASWLSQPAAEVVRYHWAFLGVNADGVIPSASPSPTVTPQPPTPAPSPSGTPSATPLPSATPTPSPVPCRVWVSVDEGPGMWLAKPPEFCR